MRHRLTLAAEYEMEGARVDEVLEDLLHQVAAPRVSATPQNTNAPYY